MSRAERLDRARSVLRQASSGSVVPAGERILPVAEPFRALLPAGGLRRGTVVVVRSSTALLLAVLAETSTRGGWCALVGMPELGMVAAAEAGLRLDKVALVPRPGADLVAVTAALLDGLDLVAVAGTQRLGAGERQRLAARARQRGAVLLAVGDWPGADVELSGAEGRWQGLADAGADAGVDTGSGVGAGRLRCRRVRVRVRARGRASAYRDREATVLVPGPDGAPVVVSPVAVSPVSGAATLEEVG